MKVLVRFKGGNDLGQLMKAFGELLLPKVEREADDITPENVALWFNKIAPTLYEMHAERSTPDRLKQVVEKYLKIAAADVYIDQDVEVKMQTAHEWANYNSVMIDGSGTAIDPVYLV